MIKISFIGDGILPSFSEDVSLLTALRYLAQDIWTPHAHVRNGNYEIVTTLSPDGKDLLIAQYDDPDGSCDLERLLDLNDHLSSELPYGDLMEQTEAVQQRFERLLHRLILTKYAGKRSKLIQDRTYEAAERITREQLFALLERHTQDASVEFGDLFFNEAFLPWNECVRNHFPRTVFVDSHPGDVATRGDSA